MRPATGAAPARGAVGRRVCSRSRRDGGGAAPGGEDGRRAHRCARAGGSGHERDDLRHGVRGHPGQLVVTPGGLWMADFRGGVLWRYEPGAERLERITSNGEPRDLAASGQGLRGGRRPFPVRGGVPLRRGDRGARGRDRPAGLRHGLRRGRAVGGRMPGRPAAEHGSRRLRKLHEVFLPFQSPSPSRTRACSSASWTSGEGSLWVLGDALDRRMWRLDGAPRGCRRRSSWASPRRPPRWRTDRSGSPTACATGRPPRPADNGRLLGPFGGPRPRGVAAGAGRGLGGEHAGRHAVAGGPANATSRGNGRGGWRAPGVAVGAGAVWVTEHEF